MSSSHISIICKTTEVEWGWCWFNADTQWASKGGSDTLNSSSFVTQQFTGCQIHITISCEIGSD